MREWVSWFMRRRVGIGLVERKLDFWRRDLWLGSGSLKSCVSPEEKSRSVSSLSETDAGSLE